MAERERRQRAKPLAEMEEEEQILHDMFLTFIHEDPTDLQVDQLRTLSKNLRGAYEAACNILSDLMLKYEAVGSPSEARKASEKWRRLKRQFGTRYTYLKERRTELEDDQLSSYQASELSSADLEDLKEISGPEKVRQYLSEVSIGCDGGARPKTHPPGAVGATNSSFSHENPVAANHPNTHPPGASAVMPTHVYTNPPGPSATVNSYSLCAPAATESQPIMPPHVKPRCQPVISSSANPSQETLSRPLISHEISTSQGPQRPSRHFEPAPWEDYYAAPKQGTLSRPLISHEISTPQGPQRPNRHFEPAPWEDYYAAPKQETATVSLPTFNSHIPQSTHTRHTLSNPRVSFNFQRDRPPGGSFGPTIKDRTQGYQFPPYPSSEEPYPSSLGPHPPPEPFLPRTTAYSTEKDTMMARFLVKSELQKMDPAPFSGEALKFHAWAERVRRRIEGLNLQPLEILDVLERSTKGEPQKIIQDYLESAPGDPTDALSRTWQELFRCYGTPTKIFAELNHKLRSFPPIKTHNDVTKMRELNRVCRQIILNMHSVREFDLFNSEEGMSRILRLIPPSTFERYRKAVYRLKLRGDHPGFNTLADIVEDQLQEVLTVEVGVEPRKGSCLTAISGPTQPVPPPPPKVDRLPNPEGAPTQTRSFSCIIHKSNKHSLGRCSDYVGKSVGDRLGLVREHSLCYNCLGSHYVRECKSKFKCRECNRSHHTSLHQGKGSSSSPARYNHDQPREGASVNKILGVNQSYPTDSAGAFHTSVSRKEGDTSEPETEEGDSSPEVDPGAERADPLAHHVTMASSSGQVRVTTSKVLLVDILSEEREVRCYCVLDEQSDTSFMSEELASILGLTGPTVPYDLSTMSGLDVKSSGVLISNLKVRGVNERASYALPPVLTNPFIPNCTAEVTSREDAKSHPVLRKYYRKFNPFDPSASVMLLIGRDAGDLMATKCYGNRAPFIHQTKLGFAAVGLSKSANKTPKSVLKTNLALPEHLAAKYVFSQPYKGGSLPHIEDCLVRCPDDELVGYSQDERDFMRKVSEGFGINETGNIQISLPFRDEDPIFPNNSKSIFVRTLNMTENLKKDPGKLESCVKTMGEYLSAGHIEAVPNDEPPPSPGKAFWLPLLAVKHPKKDSTRMVFDSSAKYRGISLNQKLLQGPDHNNSLRGVLLRFRCGPVGVSGDIMKMFHNFYLPPADRNFLRFFWFKENNPGKPLVQYRACVHIFGNSPSPAIANFGLKSTVTCASSPPAEATKAAIYRSFYVDDALVASDSSKEAVEVVLGMRRTLSEFNIRLHKLASNSHEVMSAIPNSEKREDLQVSIGETSACSALGLKWNLEGDSLMYAFKVTPRPFTKRGVVSITNSLFDPLGFVSPVVLGGRLLQRRMFAQLHGESSDPLGWDDPLPQEHLHLWDRWLQSLTYLSNFSVPRSIYSKSVAPYDLLQLHVFADASEEAVGYVIFARTRKGSLVESTNVCAGSKVAPRAATSIPRLELSGALEASTAALQVREELSIREEDCYMYTDSKVTLGYLGNKSKKFSRYISRRVELIGNSCGKSPWHYVASADNPADLCTRPSAVHALMTPLWLHGPEFLLDSNYDPLPPQDLETLELPEVDHTSLKVKRY